jgi:hypothetical protein
MRRYKIVACILLILSIFSFVLAAPVAVQELRKVCADAVDGSENVKTGSGKRAEVQDSEEDPMKKWLAQAQQEPSSSSQDQGSSSAPNYARGIYPNPSFSPGESKPPQLSTSGGTELSWNPEGDPPSQPEDVNAKIFDIFDKIQFGPKMAAQKSPSPDIELASPSSYSDPPSQPEDVNAKIFDIFDKIQFGPKVAAQKSPSPDIELASPSSSSDGDYLSSGESYPSDHGYENYHASNEGEPGPGLSKSYSDSSANTDILGVGTNVGGSPGSTKSYPPSDGPGPDLASNEGTAGSSMSHTLSIRPEMVGPVLEPSPPEPKKNFIIRLFSKSKNFFGKLAGKLKFWRRTSKSVSA